MLAMEPCSWTSTSCDLDRLSDAFLMNSGLQAQTRNGSCSTSSLVLDSERGELVEATVRVERKGVSAERSIAALRNHSEAERKRRARINAHLDTLRSLVPGTIKMDKATLLAEVISHLKVLKRKAAEVSKGLLVPLDVDEVRVEKQEDCLDGGQHLIRASLCCDCKPGILSDLRQALDAFQLIIMRAEIATLEGRMKNVFLLTSSKEGPSDDSELHQSLAGSVHQAIRSILNKFSAAEELSLKSTLTNKRRRISIFHSSLSSPSGDLW